MVAAQAWLELRALLRNGEQLLLTLIIPVVLLVGFSLEHLINGTRVDFLVPGIIALGIMSTAFTSQAIATGFERQYGVLKRLGATPLRRGGLIAAKTSTVRRGGAGPDRGDHRGRPAARLVTGRPAGRRAVGAAAHPGRARRRSAGWPCCWPARCAPEATLAAANLIYLVLLGLGGVVFSLDKFPAGARPVLLLLPTGALSDGLHTVLQHGAGLPVKDLVVLLVWAVAGIGLTTRVFRWE